MSFRLKNSIAVIVLVMVIAAPSLLMAQVTQASIPKTPIDKILTYKNGLDLTDSQIHKLTIINRTLVDKMIQVRAQAQIRKMEIDEFTSNWSNMHGTAVNHIIDEYYDFLAELKKLELEAIMKTKAVLSREQIKKYTELAAIESMIIKLDAGLAAND
jgi:hypothetical protein